MSHKDRMGQIQDVIIVGDDDNQVSINAEGQMHVVLMGRVDDTNSSSTPLDADEVFTGVAFDTLDFGFIFVTIFSDVASATSGFSVQQSSDGTNWDNTDEFTIPAGTGKTYSFQPAAKWFRIVYTNGVINQTEFRLQTIFKKTSSLPSSHRISNNLSPEDDASLNISIIKGQKPDGDYTDFSATTGGNFKVSLEEFDSTFDASPLPVSETSKTTFGEVSVAEPWPVVQLQFPYNINEDIIETRNNHGTSIVENNMAVLSTGALSNQSANILSKVPIKYNPGQGGMCRFTSIYNVGMTNSTQFVGIGNPTEGYFFGYDGFNYGVLRRSGGVPEVRRLAITTASDTLEQITITLDGNPVTGVTVTAAGVDSASTRTITANDIASYDFSDIGEGWEVHTMGANVFFTSYSDGSDKDGTYTLSDAATAVGTFSRSLVGITTTEDFIPQTSWNRDKFMFDSDPNNSKSGVNVDPTKGNVYQIKYQWLGFGAIDFYIENPSTGLYTLVHKIEYANKNMVTSVNNPTLPLCASVKNKSNDTDIVLKIGSMGGFVEGRDTLQGLPKSISVESLSIGTTETPIITIHSHDIYKGTVNRVRTKMTEGSVSIESTKPATVRVRKNATIVGSAFSALNSNTSVTHVDTSSTVVTGGILIFAEGVEKNGTVKIDFEKLGISLVAPEFLTLSIEASSGTVDSVSTLNWQELF